MGKVPKLKKQRPQSVRSRAARRAPSPSQIQKSLDSTTSEDQYTYSKPPAASTDGERPESALGAQYSSTGGISKKKRGNKKQHLSRAQRLRKERGMARADVVSEQLAEKVRRSKKRGKVVKERRGEWGDLNGKLGVEEVSKEKRKGEGRDAEGGIAGDGEVVVKGDEVMVDVQEGKGRDVIVNGESGLMQTVIAGEDAVRGEQEGMGDLDNVT